VTRLLGLLLGAAALVAAPASALEDLTGVYVGTLDCAWTNDEESTRGTFGAELHVDDDGAGNAHLYSVNSGFAFRASVVSPSATPTRGRVGGPACNLLASTGGYVVHATAETKAGKASLRGEFILLRVGASEHLVQVCRFVLRRSPTPLPEPIPGCP
jgi:hypothetical protein